ncbi:DUF445 domain-containing protein [bacterium DOLZORAL124_64_63]|nr:MAG: DUF445 domain-containing protein [bacterium DOLZORAL124_64_63]
MTKSLATNLLALLCIAAGYLSPAYGDILRSIGFFAFSGAITNWLAIHMLFEKVPGLYGSGVIPNRFTEFKQGIKDLMMQEFFTPEHINDFFAKGANGPDGATLDAEALAKAVDKDRLFGKLLEVINESSFGGMLAMVGGVAALEPLRQPFGTKVDEALVEIAGSEDFQAALAGGDGADLGTRIQRDVATIVDGRLAQLTKEQVKRIIQDIIRKHLGWLVVWGGVFGGLIGALMTFVD